MIVAAVSSCGTVKVPAPAAAAAAAATWHLAPSRPAASGELRRVSSPDASHGWTEGGGIDELFGTNDGGLGWQQVPVRLPGAQQPGFGLGLVFTNDHNGWLAGLALAHTTDGGATWSSQSPANIRSIDGYWGCASPMQTTAGSSATAKARRRGPRSTSPPTVAAAGKPHRRYYTTTSRPSPSPTTSGAGRWAMLRASNPASWPPPTAVVAGSLSITAQGTCSTPWPSPISSTAGQSAGGWRCELPTVASRGAPSRCSTTRCSSPSRQSIRSSVWVAGQGGIWASSDGGVSWRHVWRGNRIYSLSFSDPAHGWAVGSTDPGGGRNNVPGLVLTYGAN